MTDRIIFEAYINDDHDVSDVVKMSFTVGEYDSATDVLVQMKRFLIAIGYEWVEAVNVTAHDPLNGALVVHSTDPVEEWEDDAMGEPEGTA
jgi:hypothetical protein